MIRKVRSGSCVEVPSRLYNVSKLTALVARRIFRTHQGGSVLSFKAMRERIAFELIKYLDQMIRKVRSGSCVEVPSRLYNVSKLTALVARRVFRAHQGGSVIVNPNQSIPIGATFLETPKKLQPPHLQIAVHKCKSCIPPMHNLWISCSQPGITHPSKSPGQVNLLVC